MSGQSSGFCEGAAVGDEKGAGGRGRSEAQEGGERKESRLQRKWVSSAASSALVDGCHRQMEDWCKKRGAAANTAVLRPQSHLHISARSHMKIGARPAPAKTKQR